VEVTCHHWKSTVPLLKKRHRVNGGKSNKSTPWVECESCKQCYDCICGEGAVHMQTMLTFIPVAFHLETRPTHV